MTEHEPKLPSPPPSEGATTPTDEQIAEWERLANEATPGPWKDINQYGIESVYTDHPTDPRGVAAPDTTCDEGVATANVDCEDDEEHVRACRDMAFIASARTAIPALVAEVRRLRSSSRPSSEPGERARALEEAACWVEAQARLDDPPGWVRYGYHSSIAAGIRALASAPSRPTPPEATAPRMCPAGKPGCHGDLCYVDPGIAGCSTCGGRASPPAAAKGEETSHG